MNKPVPFRKWYGNLGQLREILANVCFMVCTATASLSTKSKIFSVLSINSDETFIVEMSPERKNLRYVVQYVNNSIPMSELFQNIIMEVRKGKDKTTKTLLYCQTRNQCAILWRMFKLELSIDIYLNGCPTPTGYLVQMFHAGTPESATKMILESVCSYDNHIRVVICTIAFGMGINCRGVERVIHFGPSANVECYLQECGRAGRDGRDSTCILLYNGFLSSHCSDDMKEYIKGEKCRRRVILNNFPGSHEVQVAGCKCCDVCAKKCTCSGLPGNCHSSLLFEVGSIRSTVYKFRKNRVVTDEQRSALKAKLFDFLAIYRKSDVKHVLYPNVLLEFGKFHIAQILLNCHQLFSVEDICNCVEIWRMEHANNILLILANIFKDVDNSELEFENVDMEDVDCMVESEWADVRDDSLVHLLMNESNISEINGVLTESDESEEEDMDVSDIMNKLAVEVSKGIDIDISE
jgi:hypothetical protein